MRPHVLVHRRRSLKVSNNRVPADSIRGLPGYKAASLGGCDVTAVALRHRVKYEWMTRPRDGSPVVYRQTEFLVFDDPPTCYYTLYLLSKNRVGKMLEGRHPNLDPGLQATICDALNKVAFEAIRMRWDNTMAEVEVVTETVMSYDREPWWCRPVPWSVVPASTTSAVYPMIPIEALEMEVYEEEGEGGDGAEECAICLDDFVPGTEVERLPCRHRFHGECLLRWLERRGSCPTCRSEFPIH